MLITYVYCPLIIDSSPLTMKVIANCSVFLGASNICYLIWIQDEVAKIPLKTLEKNSRKFVQKERNIILNHFVNFFFKSLIFELLLDSSSTNATRLCVITVQ